MRYGSLKPQNYIPRIAELALEDLLDSFGAVEVAGTMWCGKTWTSLSYGNSVAHIGAAHERAAAESDPSTALVGSRPHVIDEWQDVPPIWDEVRYVIDASGNEPGQFILTGSSRPSKQGVSHSGAGRIAKLRMHTMSLAETNDSSQQVSLKKLWKGEFEPVRVSQKLSPIAGWICRGGWPALQRDNKKRPGILIKGYLDALFDVNIPKKGLDGIESRRVALSLARNMGNAIRLNTVATDAGFDTIDPKSAAAKASSHISALEDLYALERLEGWDAPVRAKSRVRTRPKYYFSDPSIAASLLSASPERLVSDGQLFGILFEALCIHDMTVYASVFEDAAPLRYYRDSDGLEVDLIMEMHDGRWAAFEIKLGENKAPEAAKALHRLEKKVANNPAAQNPKPEFLAVIVGAGELAYFNKELGVYIIPLSVLCA